MRNTQSKNKQKNHQTTFFPKSFLMRKEIEAILGRITLTLHSPAPWMVATVVKEKIKDKGCSSWSFSSYRNTTAECPWHSRTIELPGVSLYTLHEQKRTEELQKGWCGMKSNAWVVFNRLSVSEEDLLAITVPYVTQSYSLFYIMCLECHFI